MKCKLRTIVNSKKELVTFITIMHIKVVGGKNAFMYKVRTLVDFSLRKLKCPIWAVTRNRCAKCSYELFVVKLCRQHNYFVQLSLIVAEFMKKVILFKFFLSFDFMVPQQKTAAKSLVLKRLQTIGWMENHCKFLIYPQLTSIKYARFLGRGLQEMTREV